MKKVFGQTVRDLKREVNKKVLKVPGVEQKILDATSNEPWGPHGSHLAELALATRNYHEYQLIMAVIWKRINDTGKNWRHVFKSLIVLEYLVAHGSERVIDEIREHAYQISTLADFQYVDSSGRDQGSNIRRKSQSLVALVNDKERIHEVRQKAQSNKDRYHGTSSTSGAYRTSSYSATGGHGDSYDDNRLEARYGRRDDDRYGYGRERDQGYKDDGRYGRGRDSYSQDGDQRSRDSDENQFRSRSRSVDGYTDRSFDDDDHYSIRSGDSRAEEHSLDERQFERKLSEHDIGAPPSYEEATQDAQSSNQEERDEETVAGTTKNISSPSHKPVSPAGSTNQVPNQAVGCGSVAPLNKEVNAFEEFDPRGSVSAVPRAASSPELDIFGLSTSDSTDPLAMVPATSTTTTSEAHVPTNAAFGMDQLGPSSSSSASNQLSEDPFGDSPFKAVPQENLPTQPQNAPVTSFQPSGSVNSSETLPSVASKAETFPNFDFGDTLGGLTYEPIAVSGQHSSASLSFSDPMFSMVQTNNDILDSIFPRTGFASSFSSQEPQPVTPTDLQTPQTNLLPPSGTSAPAASQGSPTNMHTMHTNFFHPSGLSAPVVSQGSPTYAQTAPMDNFQQSGLSTPLASQGSPTTTQATQVNISQPSGLAAPASSQGVPTDTLTNQMKQVAPGASQGLPTNSQTAQMNLLQPPWLSASSAVSQGSAEDMQTAQMNFMQPSGLSASASSQGSTTNMQTSSQGSAANMQTSQMNFLPPSELSAQAVPQGSATNIQTGQMNFLQPSGLPAPATSQGSATDMQMGQMNFLLPSGAPVMSQGSTAYMQAGQMNSLQPSGLSAPAVSQACTTDMKTGQMTSLQPSGLPAPAMSQGSATDMQTGQMNFHHLSGLSAPAMYQGSLIGMQTGQMNFLQPSGPSAPGVSQGSTANMQTGQMNFLPPSVRPASAMSQGSAADVQTGQISLLQQSGLPASAAPQAAQAAILTNMQAGQSGSPANMQTTQLNLGPQSMLSDPFTAAPGATGALAKPQPSKQKFEPKSNVWADTLSRGLVDFNISGPKTNPLADIGVDFDAINRKERRLEAKSSAAPATSTITMGKAMGSGSGIGRAAATGLALPPNPTMGSGMGMGAMGMSMGGMGMGGGAGMGMGNYGGNMNQPPMGMGMNMGMGMGMNMGMGQGVQMRPPTGMPPPGPSMPGAGYNPMMGMGGYGSQQPYGGGYR